MWPVIWNTKLKVIQLMNNIFSYIKINTNYNIYIKLTLWR